MRTRRRNIRPVVLITAAALLLGACGSTSSSHGKGGGTPKAGGGQYGHLPTASGTPRNGGTVTIAEAPGAGPTSIFPITSGANDTVYAISQFQNYMFRPLWWGPKGDVPEMDLSQSIASGPPTFRDKNRIVTIHLRHSWKWSDGTPVTSADVAFFIELVKAAVKLSPANYGPYTPGLFPDFITSVSTPDKWTVVLHLNATYNANFIYLDQLALITPLPAQAWARARNGGPLLNWHSLRNAEAIYNYLNKQSEVLGTYGSNPLWQVVDGPFRLKSFDPSNDANTLVVNRAYTGPVKPHIHEIDDVAFTSTSSEFDQLLTGALDVGYVDFSNLRDVGRVIQKGYKVWGYPDFGFNFITYNFRDRTGHFNKIIGQLYVRQALAHLQNEPAVIKSRGAFDGAAGPAYGPVPQVPRSPFAPANALKNPYPYSIKTAKRILVSHGWKVVPGGTTTCRRPGRGANECGAGIPKGTPLRFNLFYANSPAVIGTQCEAYASNARQVGIEINLVAKTFNFILANQDDVSEPKNDNQWATQDYGGFTDSYYPTTNEIFNTTGSNNDGEYSSKEADRLINASVRSLNSSAVTKELSYIIEQQPGLFQPNADQIYAFSDSLGGPPASFADASQFQYSPEYWYFKKRTH